MPERQSTATDFREERARSRHRALVGERIWFGALSVIAAVVIFVFGTAALAAIPNMCGWCHVSVAKSARHAPHAQLKCGQCHAGATSYDVLANRVDVANMVIRQLTPGTRKLKSDIDSAPCLVCHEKEMSSTKISKGIRMSHKTPLEKGWSCQTCHPATGHATTTSLTGYTMDMCMGCHSANPGSLATCEVCHPGQTATAEGVRTAGPSPWRVTHGANWRSTHGMGNLATCGGCHASGFCSPCHGANVPHPPTYMRDHGADVASRGDGRDACLTCHLPSSCDNCHGVSMPHPAGFLKRHSALVKKEGRTVCLRCHQAKSCTGCHSRHIHPGLPKSTIDQLRAHPVSSQ